MYSHKKSPLVWFSHITVLVLVVLWTIPTFGLLVTSLRDKDQIVASGWWTSLATSTQNLIYRTPGEAGQTQEGGLYINAGNALEGGAGVVSRFGTSSLSPEEYEVGQTVDLDDGMQLRVEENALLGSALLERNPSKSRGHENRDCTLRMGCWRMGDRTLPWERRR